MRGGAAGLVVAAIIGACTGPTEPSELDQAMCEAMGLRWFEASCRDLDDPDVDCESRGLAWIDGGCAHDESTCVAAGLVWLDGACLTPEDECVAEGRVWLDEECLTVRDSCRFNGHLWLNAEGTCADTQEACEAAELAWMEDTCFDYARCTGAGTRCWIEGVCIEEGALGPAGAIGGCPQCRPARVANDWSDTCFGHDTFADFSAFEEGASLEGSDNLFVSRDGFVELIRATDLDCDGHGELVVTSAVSGDVGSSDPDTQSFLYRGAGSGLTDAGRLDGFGVGAAAVADLSGDGSLDVVLANRAFGMAGEPSPAYCGAATPICADHAFDPGAVACDTFDAGDAHEVEVADIDRDGRLDLIFASTSLTIFWSGVGRGTSLDTTRRGVRIADVNRDEIPDIVAVGETRTHVYLGDGRRPRSSTLPDFAIEGPGASACIADLDDDGTLDLVVASGGTTEAMVHWGPLDTTERTCPGSSCMAVPGSANATACSIADLDGDGQLDIAFSRDAGVGMADLPSTLHFASDSYAATALPGSRAASGITIAELIEDSGGLDIFLALERSPADEYATDSLLYRGVGDGTFDSPLNVPSVGASRGVTHDYGNVYDRDAEDAYASAPFDLGESLAAVPVTLSWTADARTPLAEGGVTMQICVSETSDCDAFVGPDGTGATSFGDPSGATFDATGRYVRYRAVFSQPGFLARPRLDDVSLRY